MAAPTYNTDLATINLCTGTWIELTGATAGGAPTSDGDYFILNANCINATANATGMMSVAWDNSTGISITAGSAVFIWLWFGAPNAIATFASGGMRVGIGSDASNYKMWNVYGSDTYTYGGWVNEAIDPTVTQSSSYGSPTSTTQVFGHVVNNANKVAKGQVLACGGIRWGRTLYIESGESGSPGTFTAAAAKNDANDGTNGYNRWGLFQAIKGGFLMKGRFRMGTDSTAVYFSDSNKAISVQACPYCQSDFSVFEIRNSSSQVFWTNISVTALGTNARGNFLVTAGADIDLTGCTFTDMGTFSFNSNTAVSGCVFRRCGQVTQSGATIDGCVFTNSYAAISLSSADPASVTNCEFISDGSNHAIEITATGTYAFSGHTFTGYDTGNGGSNAVVYNNSGGSVTINVTNCVGTVSYLNGSGASTTVNSTINLTITGLVAGSDVVIYSAGTETVLDSVDQNPDSDWVYSYGAGGVDIDVGVFKPGYVPLYVRDFTLPSTSGTLPVKQKVDIYYID